MKTPSLFESLQVLLNRSTEIMNEYEEGKFSFISSVKSWLTAGETVLRQYNKPQVSRLAGLRGVILAAEQGNIDPSYPVNSKSSKRKNATAVAALCFNQAQDIIQTMVEPLYAKEQEAADLLKQIVLVANQKKILQEFHRMPEVNDQALSYLWGTMNADPEIKAGLDRVLMLVSFTQARDLLKTIFDEWPQHLRAQVRPVFTGEGRKRHSITRDEQ